MSWIDLRLRFAKVCNRPKAARLQVQITVRHILGISSTYQLFHRQASRKKFPLGFSALGNPRKHLGCIGTGVLNVLKCVYNKPVMND